MKSMNLRERFLDIMHNFNTDITSIKWEFKLVSAFKIVSKGEIFKWIPL